MINFKQARRYCSEDLSQIENYAEALADTARTWDVHHRAEVLPCGRFSMEDLKRHGLYWKVPASHLVFLTAEQHHRVHMTGKEVKAATRLKISLAGRRREVSQATRLKLAIAGKARRHSAETRRKMSESHKRRHASLRENPLYEPGGPRQ